MATVNFGYENRCVIVSNDDIEIENIPSTGENVGTFRNSLYVLDDYDDFEFFNIVLGYGYYKGAFIDYRDKDFNDDWWYIDNASSKNELAKLLFDDFGKHLGRSLKTFRKHMENTGSIEDAFEKAYEWMLDVERAKVNKVIDGIKQYYGYDECVCLGVMGNGEGVYKMI